MTTEEPSEILRNEHDSILELLRALDGMARALARGGTIPPGDVATVLEAIVNFADRCHHAKEEDALFPVLIKAFPRESGALVRELQDEHATGRRFVSELQDASRGPGPPGGRSAQEFARAGEGYVALLRRHIALESARLTPMTDRLPAEQRSSLSAEFEAIDRRVLGAGVHEKYERTAHVLGGKYAATP